MKLIIYQGVNMSIWETIKNMGKSKDSKRNFKYLNRLIHSGSKNVDLDSSIAIGNLEIKFVQGIKIDVDDLVIDGHNYTIDSRERAPIFNISGKNIIIRNITFINGSNQLNGGAIIIQEGASCKFENCNFKNNIAKQGAGALHNVGEIELFNCVFKGNISDNGGAILNTHEGCINAKKVTFEDNKAISNGGAIGNFGKITLNDDCSFLGNTAKNEGGAINSQNGIITCKKVHYAGNTAVKSGGAIVNHAELNLIDSNFENNQSDSYAGVLDSQSGGKNRISRTIFRNNNAKIDASVIYNECEDIRFNDCKFLDNKNGNVNLIYNKMNSIEFFDSKFLNNHAKSIIWNNNNSNLIVLDGEFINNINQKATINNYGESCSFTNTIFESNKSINSSSEKCIDIYNESLLTLNAVKFKNLSRIDNKGHVVVSNMDSIKFKDLIESLKSVEFLDIPENLNNNNEKIMEDTKKLNFTNLDELVHSCPLNNLLNLKYDFMLNKNELKFYEGGIDLDVDNLVIEGNNRVIDANNISRIFNVIGDNITLKNIIFKNGSLKNIFDEHTNGGGAIRIAKGAKLILENCKFISNYSDNDGGAILNNGILDSISSKFENNESKYYGGAIHNKNNLTTKNDIFENNISYIAGAIYNNDTLNIEGNIELKENKCTLKDIYNVNRLFFNDKLHEFIDNKIFNTGLINQNLIDDYITFYDFNKLIENNDEITLKQNIVFNLTKDKKIKNGIEINKDIVIDGNNHSIDGNYLTALFNINEGNVTLKNLTIKHMGKSEHNIIENNSNLIIENCKFNMNKTISDYNLINNKNTLIIVNCNFYNNIVNKSSLIINESKIDIIDSSLINNISNSTGGVISNTSKNNRGIFKKGYHSGGLISNQLVNKMYLKNTNFRNNVSNQNGGCIINLTSGILELDYSGFYNNISKASGGAINTIGDIIKINHSIFEGNYSGNRGGAIESISNLEINNSQFYNNQSKSSGGAILNQKNITINNSTFEKNSTKGQGGAITNHIGGKLNVTKSSFIKNKAKEAGAIAMSINDNPTIRSCNFEGNLPESF